MPPPQPPVLIYTQPAPSGKIHQNYASRSSLILGIIQIFIGSVVIILEIIALAGWIGTHYRAFGLWCGAFTVAAGITGIFAAKQKTIGWIFGFMAMSILAAITSIGGQLVVHSLAASELNGGQIDVDRYAAYELYRYEHDVHNYTDNESTGYIIEFENKTITLLLDVTLIVLALVECIVAIVSAVVVCYGTCCTSIGIHASHRRAQGDTSVHLQDIQGSTCQPLLAQGRQNTINLLPVEMTGDQTTPGISKSGDHHTLQISPELNMGQNIQFSTELDNSCALHERELAAGTIDINKTKTRSFYIRGWILKLVLMSILAFTFFSISVLFAIIKIWYSYLFALMFILTLAGIVMVIVRIKNPKGCYRNANCCFCPCSYGDIDELGREVNSHLPAAAQWEGWHQRTLSYTRPITEFLYQHTHAHFHTLSSGGSGERCAVPVDVQEHKCAECKCWYSGRDVTPLRSDHDVMLVPDITASEDIQGQPIQTQLRILTENGITPGYAQLVLNDSSMSHWAPYCYFHNGWYYLETDGIRRMTLKAVKKAGAGSFNRNRSLACCNSWALDYVSGRIVRITEEGPAVKLSIEDDHLPCWTMLLCCLIPIFCVALATLSQRTRIVYFEADIMISIFCPVWPKCARQWITRARYWPSVNLVKEVVASGCHLVPKAGTPNATARRPLEWRWSFSSCENMMSLAYPSTAKTCYLLLKILIKGHLKYTSPVLKTYHAKTVLLWTIEKSPPEFWTNSSTEECLDVLLAELMDFANSKRCPNYWLPEVNLFHDMEDPAARHLVKVLGRVRSRPDLYFANFASVCCGHRMLNCFNVSLIAYLFVLIAAYIGLGYFLYLIISPFVGIDRTYSSDNEIN